MGAPLPRLARLGARWVWAALCLAHVPAAAPQAGAAWPACEECKAITYQMAGHLTTRLAGRRRKKDLRETELVELFEDACETDVFEKYTVKRHAATGSVGIRGPGLGDGDGDEGGASDENFDSQLRGLQNNLPRRMSARCTEIVGNMQEEKLYSIYKYMKSREGTDRAAFCGTDSKCDVTGRSFGLGICISEVGDCTNADIPKSKGGKEWVMKKEVLEEASAAAHKHGSKKEDKKKKKKKKKKKTKIPKKKIKSFKEVDLNGDGKLDDEEMARWNKIEPREDKEKMYARQAAAEHLMRLKEEGKDEEIQQYLRRFKELAGST